MSGHGGGGGHTVTVLQEHVRVHDTVAACLSEGQLA